MSSSNRFATCLVVAVAMTAACGAPRQAVNSTPATGSIQTDADRSDWSRDLIQLEDQQVSLAIRNDGESLHLLLQSDDRGVAGQILALGLTVWFDPDGGTDRVFGVQYPVGLLNSDAAASINPGQAQQDPDQLATLVDGMRGEVILHRKNAGEEHWALQDVLALEADFEYEGESFTYELRVPLQTTWTRYAVGAAPGDVVGVGVETPEIDRAAMRAGFGGRPPTTGGGPPGGARPEPPKRLNVWLQVPLATAPGGGT